MIHHTGQITGIRPFWLRFDDFFPGLNCECRLHSDIFAARPLLTGTSRRPTQSALAERFGITHEQVRTALQKVGKCQELSLRQELRDRLGLEPDIDEEIRLQTWSDRLQARREQRNDAPKGTRDARTAKQFIPNGWGTQPG